MVLGSAAGRRGRGEGERYADQERDGDEEAKDALSPRPATPISSKVFHRSPSAQNRAAEGINLDGKNGQIVRAAKAAAAKPRKSAVVRQSVFG